MDAVKRTSKHQQQRLPAFHRPEGPCNADGGQPSFFARPGGRGAALQAPARQQNHWSHRGRGNGRGRGGRGRGQNGYKFSDANGVFPQNAKPRFQDNSDTEQFPAAPFSDTNRQQRFPQDRRMHDTPAWNGASDYGANMQFGRGRRPGPPYRQVEQLDEYERADCGREYVSTSGRREPFEYTEHSEPGPGLREVPQQQFHACESNEREHVQEMEYRHSDAQITHDYDQRAKVGHIDEPGISDSQPLGHRNSRWDRHDRHNDKSQPRQPSDRVAAEGGKHATRKRLTPSSSYWESFNMKVNERLEKAALVVGGHRSRRRRRQYSDSESDADESDHAVAAEVVTVHDALVDNQFVSPEDQIMPSLLDSPPEQECVEVTDNRARDQPGLAASDDAPRQECTPHCEDLQAVPSRAAAVPAACDEASRPAREPEPGEKLEPHSTLPSAKDRAAQEDIPANAERLHSAKTGSHVASARWACVAIRVTADEDPDCISPTISPVWKFKSPQPAAQQSPIGTAGAQAEAPASCDTSRQTDTVVTQIRDDAEPLSMSQPIEASPVHSGSEATPTALLCNVAMRIATHGQPPEASGSALAAAVTGAPVRKRRWGGGVETTTTEPTLRSQSPAPSESRSTRSRLAADLSHPQAAMSDAGTCCKPERENDLQQGDSFKNTIKTGALAQKFSARPAMVSTAPDNGQMTPADRPGGSAPTPAVHCSGHITVQTTAEPANPAERATETTALADVTSLKAVKTMKTGVLAQKVSARPAMGSHAAVLGQMSPANRPGGSVATPAVNSSDHAVVKATAVPANAAKRVTGTQHPGTTASAAANDATSSAAVQSATGNLSNGCNCGHRFCAQFHSKPEHRQGESESSKWVNATKPAAKQIVEAGSTIKLIVHPKVSSSQDTGVSHQLTPSVRLVSTTTPAAASSESTPTSMEKAEALPFATRFAGRLRPPAQVCQRSPAVPVLPPAPKPVVVVAPTQSTPAPAPSTPAPAVTAKPSSAGAFCCYFNIGQDCPFGNCIFLHVCHKCGSGEHGGHRCTAALPPGMVASTQRISVQTTC
eukprot:jgi/Chlat1/1707/Chrsp127S01929